ncbi:hypothetical protein [Alicyclobacillus acidoterrestris]|uniref:Uncharacterized protein n=1 Tax=Alicyclobacillus acidoterrestris (strain ATCC 49025 / DSM 3922 / CIP 106132 / NCIMB 13137 / GD3B) TaxID=1356854 RepID=T0CXB2_ALIAG|nr:hypothetical protein [Alicyclobacillus acidoterrestris]EPZ42151.1 hypothetical protein N007_16050 [Alicyclobacillus acidoterrestris ATCC 49025]UNO50833.1 hypothetical protein K1I37_09620 [Alicyclobacillus acidoterrestris]
MRPSPIQPLPARPSRYGIDPQLVKKRFAELPGMTSVTLRELFPDSPNVIYPSSEGIAAIRRATEEKMEKMDLSMIQPHQSVNVLASHHGFTLLGGEPYAEVLRTIYDVVKRRTGAKEVRLRAGVGLRFRETEEYIKRFALKQYFDRALGMAPIDEGIPIETEIGTLYGLKRAYDADWIIHVHNSDVREVHFHRQVDRAVKPFGMSYARIETRSTYHQNLGPRAANFTARAIFESPFVQRKFVGAIFMNMSPSGVVSIEADNDLYKINDTVTLDGLRYYGKIFHLLGRIDECIVGLDFPCPVPYVFSAGVIYCNFVGANVDLFDLDVKLPPYTWYTEAFYGKDGRPLLPDISPVNPAIRMVIHNYAWIGYPSAFFAQQLPTLVVGKEQAELFEHDPQNMEYMKYAMVADNLEDAMRFAYRTTGTDKVLVFDGAVGGMNVSASLADHLMKEAPAASAYVESVLMPKWLKQRGIHVFA